MTRKAKSKKSPKASATQSTIHKATRVSGASGAVKYGDEIDEQTAVAERKQNNDIVVRGDDRLANRKLAQQIENQVGQNRPHFPHSNAGPSALPHFQQQSPPPSGHSFYETSNLKARKK